MINDFSIENMKEELARALNKADEDAKTISELNEMLLNAFHITKNGFSIVGNKNFDEYLELVKLKHGSNGLVLANNKPNKIDFPILLQDEAE